MQTTSITFIGILAYIEAAANQIRKETPPMADNINYIFYGSVEALVWLARLFGITYQEINVLIFCVGWPLVTLSLMAAIVKLWRNSQALNRRLAQGA